MQDAIFRRWLPILGLLAGSCASDQVLVMPSNGTLELNQSNQKYLVMEKLAGRLVIRGSNIFLQGSGAGKIQGDVVLESASGTTVSALQVSGDIKVENSIGAVVQNSTANSLSVVGGENVTLSGNVIVGGCNVSASNDIMVIGNVCGGATVDAPYGNFVRSTFRYNVFRNTATSGRYRLVDFFNEGLICPTNTTHIFEYNVFEGFNTAGGDEPFVFRFRCNKGGSYDAATGVDHRNRIRYNSFIAHGDQVGVYLRDAADSILFEKNAIVTVNPVFHGALLTATGNDAPGTSDPSHNLFLNNLFVSKAPFEATVRLQGLGTDNTFQGNVIVSSNGRAFMADVPTGGNHFVNNTFYSGNGAVAKYSIWGTPGAGPQNSPDLFEYNIFSYAPGSGQTVFEFDKASLPFYAGHNNLFFNFLGTNSNPGNDISFGAGYGNNPPATGSLSAWQNLAAHPDVNSRAGNPRFVSREVDPTSASFNPDFRLADATSSAIHTANDVRDLGAFEKDFACAGTWFCTDWSACIGGKELRICPGLNDCGLPHPQPYQERACGSGTGGGSGVTDTTPPTVPAGAVAELMTPTQVQLTWGASTDDDSGVAGYRVYRSIGTSNAFTLLKQVASPTTIDSSLFASTQIFYRVTAFDSAGNESAASNVVSVTTSDSAGPSTASLGGGSLPPQDGLNLPSLGGDVRISQSSCGSVDATSFSLVFALALIYGARNRRVRKPKT